MKKIKIMFTAIAVLAVVGGALAFKAVKSAKVMYELVGENCPAKTQYQTTRIIGAPTLSLFTTNNGDAGSPCPGASTTGYFTAAN